MSASAPRLDARAVHVRVEGPNLVVELADHRAISVPLSWYPRLAKASAAELADWRLIGSGEGVNWEGLDEDLSVEGMLRCVQGDHRPYAGDLSATSRTFKELAEDQQLPDYQPRSSADVKAEAIAHLKSRFKRVELVPGTRELYIVDQARVNLKTSKRNNGDPFSFQVAPAYYDLNLADFFLFVCGRPDLSFVFKDDEVRRLAHEASNEASRNPPRFTFYLDSMELEYSGSLEGRVPLKAHLNAFERIKRFKPKLSQP